MKIFLSVIALLLLAAFIPIRLRAEFGQEGFAAYVRVLFIKLRFPRSEKRGSDKKTEKEEKEKKPGRLKDITLLIEPVFKTFGKLLRMLCVRKLVINLTLASNDAFRTALIYGGAAAGVGMIFPFAENNLKIRKKKITVKADFEAEEPVVYLFCDISILIWQVLVLAVYFLYRYIKKMKEKKGIEKKWLSMH